MQHQLSREGGRVRNDIVQRLAHTDAAAEIEHSRRPAELVPAVLRDVDEPLDRKHAFRRSDQLRADVHV